MDGPVGTIRGKVPFWTDEHSIASPSERQHRAGVEGAHVNVGAQILEHLVARAGGYRPIEPRVAEGDLQPCVDVELERGDHTRAENAHGDLMHVRHEAEERIDERGALLRFGAREGELEEIAREVPKPHLGGMVPRIDDRVRRGIPAEQRHE